MELGILQQERHLKADGGEQVKVLGLERGSGLEPVDLQRTKNPLGVVLKGHAHQRMDADGADGGVADKAGYRLCVLGKHGHASLGHLAHDAPAERRSLLRWPARLHQAQAGNALVDQDDHATVSLGKQEQELLKQAGEQRVDIEGTGKTLVQLKQRLQLPSCILAEQLRI